MNNIRKKTPDEFHIFVVFFAISGIRTDLPTDIWWLRVFENADYESELKKKIKIKNGGFNMADQNLNCNYKLWN